MTITPQERARRSEDAARIRHSSEMEGGGTDAATRALQDRYVRGEITGDELIDFTRQHLASRQQR